MTMAASIPWPGPRPYDEDEWKLFFGRTQEIHDVYRRIVAQRVSLLSGASGAGKTSLLRAGVVPLLRLRRYRIKSDGETKVREWPVLVLRDWGTAEGADVAEMILGQMRGATHAFDSWSAEGPLAGEDKQAVLESLDQVVAGDNLRSLLARICGRTEGLILVFDQLEEILRAGARTAGRMTEIVRELFESELPIKLLLSLRVEHIADLRGLEKEVGGLIGRTYFLEAMKWRRIHEVVESATRVAGASIAEGVVEKVLGWLADTPEEHTETPGGMSMEGKQADERAPNLLALQAILYELFDSVQDGEMHALEVSADTLTRYEMRYGPDPKTIAGRALQRWITRALAPSESSGGTENKLAEVVTSKVGLEMREPSLTALVKRIAVRIAPHLSSGDFKVAQEQSDLFRKSLGNEVWSLGLTHPELRRKIRILEERPQRLNVEELRLSTEPSTETQRFMSGAALAGEWSQAKAAGVLFEGFHETLERLQRGNILKPIFSPSAEVVDQARSWELVHDRLGRAFADWAEEQRDTWEDCVPSLVASRGVSPIMIVGRNMEATPEQFANVYGAVDHLRWEGCVIEPLSGMALFDNVTFSHCFLRGSIFANCVFRGGGFHACELDGVLFRNCEFKCGNDGSPFVIRSSNADTLGILNSKIGDLQFEACELTQLTIKQVIVDGGMRFLHSRVFLGNFSQISSLQEGKAIQVGEGSRFLYSSGDVESWNIVRIDERARIASGPVAEEWVSNPR